MRAVFVDCTEELAHVIRARGLRTPECLEVHGGALSQAALVGCCRRADVLLVEHTKLPPDLFDACPSVRVVIFLGTGAGSYVDLDDAQKGHKCPDDAWVWQSRGGRARLGADIRRRP
jgi:D-3-phosphoglycerate dehydrogenase